MKYEVCKNESVNDGNISWTIIRPDRSIVRMFNDKSEAVDIANEFNEMYVDGV